MAKKIKIYGEFESATQEHILADSMQIRKGQKTVAEVLDEQKVNVTQNTETGKVEISIGSEKKTIINGIDNVPKLGSNNFAKSGGIYRNCAGNARTDVSSNKLDIADENGNVIFRSEDGELETKNFKSTHTPAINNNAALDNGFVVADKNGNVALDATDGNLKTKNFDSTKIIDTKPKMQIDRGFVVTDENGNIALDCTSGGIKTKDFDSDKVQQELNSLSTIATSVRVSLSDFYDGVSSDNEIWNNILNYCNGFAHREITIDRNLTINKALLVPSNTHIIIDGVTIQQADYTFDNVFRGQNVPWNYDGIDSESDFLNATDKTDYIDFLSEIPTVIERMENINIEGKNGASIIGPVTNATIYNAKIDETQDLVGDYYGVRTHQMNFAYCNHIEISGISFTQTRGWTICFGMCKNIQAHDLSFVTTCKTGDGIDFRYGCKNIKVYNINGYTEDDLLAFTCLPAPDRGDSPLPPSTGNGLFSSDITKIASINEPIENLYIENADVKDITFKGWWNAGHGMICLSAYGGKVQNIFVDGFEEIEGGHAKESVIKIYTGYGTGYISDDLNSIRINNVKCVTSGYAVMSNCKCGNVWLNKLESKTALTSLSNNNGYTITNSQIIN